MKVLWICNLMPAFLAEAVGIAGTNKEGWIVGALDTLRAHDEIELAVAFPAKTEEPFHGETEDGITYYGFIEDSDHPEQYDAALEASLGMICDEFHPEVIHVFGTEFPHTLAMLRIQEWKKRVIVHLQGVMRECAAVYLADLPQDVTERATFRDVVRKDSLWRQLEKYEQRAKHEEEALQLAQYACGRTAFDKEFLESVNPGCTYFSMNETLRSAFYSGAWEAAKATPHRIVMSQGNIPLKAVHHMIEALPQIREKYPDAELYVAGDNVVRESGMVNRLKLSEYGLYLRDLMDRLGVTDAVHFIGQQNEMQMKEMYLDAHAYVLPSMVENSPNSLGEAMLLGVPCIASRVGGIPSMAEEGEVAFFEAGDVDDLAAKVLRVFDDEEYALTLSAAGHKRAVLTFDKEANYRMLCWIYETVSKEQ